MQKLNPGATDEMAGEASRPTRRHIATHERRTKFFSPESFGPSK